jgi:hypothetical protein
MTDDQSVSVTPILAAFDAAPALAARLMQCITSADEARRFQLCGRSQEIAGQPVMSHDMV